MIEDSAKIKQLSFDVAHKAYADDSTDKEVGDMLRSLIAGMIEARIEACLACIRSGSLR